MDYTEGHKALAERKAAVQRKIARLTPQYGKPGSPIPGSRFTRDYCRMCGEPIRLPHESINDLCMLCDRGRPIGGGSTYSPPLDCPTGYNANAVRILEDGLG